MSPQSNIPESRRPVDTVVGLFPEATAAERAIRDLQDAGFSDTQIGVLMRDREQERRFAQETGTKAGEGAAAGAVTGGVLGGLVGLLTGVGALAIPGVGPIIAGGALASTLAGAGIGAAAGGLVGALIGLGIPEEEARYYERGLQEGGILVTVDAGARATEARSILLNAGAKFGPAAAQAIDEQGRERIDLREEELLASEEPETEAVMDTVRRREARIEESGAARVREPWTGKERRRRRDPSYAGPERRVVFG
jgi:hypothetical protein